MHLDGTIRRYDWGSHTAIPRLLGRPSDGHPQAEYWMGAHPSAPSTVLRAGHRTSLINLIAADPEHELGRHVLARFGPELPFLFKVIAAARPLSLQVHPNRVQATEGFAEEQRRGIPIDAPHRVYRDGNHKPELICALDDFTVLCGFRAPGRIAKLFELLDIAWLHAWSPRLRGEPEAVVLRELMAAVLTAEPVVLKQLTDDIGSAAARLAESSAVDPALAGSLPAYRDLAWEHPGDPGAVAALLLNYSRLTAGEALFLDAGMPHAYLSGVGLEVMANSDNVLRCGLTRKHVNASELLRIVDFRATDPVRIHPVEKVSGESVYQSPTAEFRLSRFALDRFAAADLTLASPQILLCVQGAAELVADDSGLKLGQGSAAFLPAAARHVAITTHHQPACVYRAWVPLSDELTHPIAVRRPSQNVGDVAEA